MTNRRLIAIHNIVDQATGKLNRDVLDALIRADALKTFGSTDPRYLRESRKMFRDHATSRMVAWRIARGLPVKMTTIAPYGARDDFSWRSIF